VSDAPAEGAFLGAARADLMLMSRLLVEESRARAVRDQALADELRARAAAAAARALGAARLPG
jgi:citrate lyase gamma subunit